MRRSRATLLNALDQSPTYGCRRIPLLSRVLKFSAASSPHQNCNKFTLDIQPVIPISISKDWNRILRTILPVVSQHDLVRKKLEPFHKHRVRSRTHAWAREGKKDARWNPNQPEQTRPRRRLAAVQG